MWDPHVVRPQPEEENYYLGSRRDPCLVEFSRRGLKIDRRGSKRDKNRLEDDGDGIGNGSRGEEDRTGRGSDTGVVPVPVFTGKVRAHLTNLLCLGKE